MRRITKNIIDAFYSGQAIVATLQHESSLVVRKKINNSSVVYENGDLVLKLHNRSIAKFIKGSLWITDSGWRTKTTKERLNGLNGVSIYQKNFKWYLNDKEWDGSWTEIKSWNLSREEKINRLQTYIASSSDRMLDNILQSLGLL